MLWQLSCLWRQMFDSWWQQPQIAFCKDPIHHPGLRAASTDCSTRILGALRTKKEFVICAWITHRLSRYCSWFKMCVLSNHTRDNWTTKEQFCWWWHLLAWILYDCNMISAPCDTFHFFAGCCELIKKGARKFGSEKSFCAHKLRNCYNIHDQWVVFPQFCSGLFWS